MESRRSLVILIIVIGVTVSSFALRAYAAFTQPSTSPPNGDAYAPLNDGPTAQTKTGSLTAGGLISGTTPNPTWGNLIAGTLNTNVIYAYGRMCVGNTLGDCTGTGGTIINATGVRFPDGTLQTTAIAGGSYLPLSGGTLTVGANVNFSGAATYGIKSNDLYLDTLNTGVTSDPLEINYRTAGPVKICASVNCGTYSAIFNTDQSVSIGGSMSFAASNPTLSAPSYFVIPGGAYFNSGTVYTEAAIQARGGIHNDSNSYLTISGGTSGNTYFSGNVGIGTNSPGAKLDVVGGNIAVGGSAGYSIYDWTNSDTNWRVGMSASPGFNKVLATAHTQFMSYSNGAGQGFAVGVNGGNSSFEIRGSDHAAYFRGGVGIGVIPAYSLDVAGNMRVASGDSSYTYYGPNASWSGQLYVGASTNRATTNTAQAISTDGNLHLDSGTNSKAIYIQYYSGQNTFINANGGNVGVGNTSPGYKLDVTGTIRTTGDIVVNGNYGQGLVGVYSDVRYQNVFAMGAAYRLSADGTSPGNLYGIAWTHSNIGGQSKPGLQHQALFMMNGVTQTAIGVGIWTIGNITAAGTAYANGYALCQSNGANCPAGSLPAAGRASFTTDDSGFHVINAEGSGSNVRLGAAWGRPGIYNNPDITIGSEGNIYFVTGNVERGHFDSSGNLTVAGTAYQHGYTVCSSENNCGYRQFNTWQNNHYSGTDGAEYATIFYDTNNSGYYVDPSGTSSFNTVSAGGTGYFGSGVHSGTMISNWPGYGTGVRMAYGAYIYPGSNSGLGDWQASYYLSSNASWGLYTNTSMYSAGGFYAPGFYYNSDLSLKKDIVTIPNALDSILKLRGVEFNWKSDGAASIGLIAQEVEKVYPELVNTNQGTGLKSVEYGNLVGPLIEAVKELAKKAETKDAQVAELQSQIDELKQEIQDLKSGK